ncbi:MAG: alpha-2-macroglobulin family protein, partial [Armatimonadia bacterium]
MSRSLRMVAVLVVMLVLMAEAVWGAAQAPNLQLSVSQRTFLVGKKAEISLSTYNLKQAALAVYPVALEALVPNASAIASEDVKVRGSLPNRLKGLNLKGLRAVKSWVVPVKKAGKDYWEDKAVAVPGLAPGVYVMTATGGGVEKRTWFAVSGRAMLTKRSPKAGLAWVVKARTGQPAVGVQVGLYDEKGKVKVAATTGEGLVKFEAPEPRTGVWVSTQVGDPAFAEADAPYMPDPYQAYIYTDRPVYRPGHLIRFRGTVREVRENDYALVSKGLETVRAQIKTRGGSTVYDEHLALNEWGSFNGEFQLAPEPPLGDYELVVTVGKGKDETVFVRSFEVEAYRKPEFTVDVKFDKDWQLGGDKAYFTISAKYLFGSPVAGGKVAYEVVYRATEDAPPARVLTAAGLGTAAIGQIEDSFKGEGRLDKDGQLRLYVQTKSLPYSRSLSVSAEVSETALRPRTAEAATHIAAADLNLDMELDNYEYVAGETAKVSFTATDHEGKPLTVPVDVRLIENLVDREGRSYEAETKQTIETDSKGKAEAQFVVKRLGYHRIEAWTADKGGNPVFVQDELQVVKKRDVRRWPSLSLNADKHEYKPGETAVLSGETDLVGSWMLVTVEGQRLYSSKVYKLQGHEFTVKVPITEQMQPNARVMAAVIRNGEMTGANESLSAPLEERKLTVIVTPNKEKYQPAETASYIVTTRDSKGAAMPAEVGLGVVDAGVYEIREDSTPDPFGYWWGGRNVRVETVFSLEQMYPGGAYQTMAPPAPSAPGMMPEAGAGGGGDEAAPRVRRMFTDTAYWGPSVVTGADGTAEVKFTVPDNLTTWRATARGITKATQAGEVQKDVIVTMPLLVRFTLPRFYVAGDEATAAATVHNYTGTERTVKVTLTADGAEVLDGAEKTVKLANDGIQKLTWKIRATGPGQAKFLVSADGGPGGKDATESTLPVLPDGVKDVLAVAGVTSDQVDLKLAAPANAVPGSALAEVTLSPSLAGPLFEALDYLTTYPYGCAEQTMDGFLPNMIVVKALQDLGANRPRPKMLDRYVSFGLQKLLRFQHGDGGWHWWEFDESDPFISAYVVYGLKLADMNGYVAAHAAMVRGTAYLREALKAEQYRDAQA